MFPTSLPSGSITIPDNATFWMPKPEDIGEDGVGAYFEDTWLIKDVPVREARRLRQEERRIAEIVSHLATTAEDFDRLANVVEEGYEPDELDEGYNLTVAEQAELDEFLSDHGVPRSIPRTRSRGFGLCPCHVRIIPAASCREHPGSDAWSNVPVVLFATTEYRAKALQPLVKATGCRFGIDPTRPELLAVMGRSILDMMALADAVLESRHIFVRLFVRPRPHPIQIVPAGGGPLNPAYSPATLRGSGSYRVKRPFANAREPAVRQPFRLLVTGSRTWDYATVIEHALAMILARHPEGVLLVHGACPRGADAIAADYAERTRTALTQTALTTLAGRELRAGARHEPAVRHSEIRRLALALGQARQQLRDNHARLLAIAGDIAPGLTSRYGAGPVSAAWAIVSFSHPGQCRSEAAVAALSGTSPIRPAAAEPSGTGPAAAATGR